MTLTPPPHSSIRTGDLIVLRNGREDTEGYIIATLPDGQYKVERVTGLGYRDRIATVTADEIRRDSDTRVDRQMSSTSKANRFDFGDCGSPFQPVNPSRRAHAARAMPRISKARLGSVPTTVMTSSRLHTHYAAGVGRCGKRATSCSMLWRWIVPSRSQSVTRCSRVRMVQSA